MEMREPLWNRRPLVYGAIGALLGGLLSLRLTGLWLLLPGALALCLAGWLLYRWQSLFLLPLCLGLALLLVLALAGTLLLSTFRDRSNTGNTRSASQSTSSITPGNTA